MLRCAKTLKKTFIGILYDRYSKNPDDATIIQGLVGRDTGYDNNGISICYTNIDSIERYEELWQSNFEDKTIKWNSKTTKYTDGILSGKNTYKDPKNYGFSVESDTCEEKKTKEKKIKEKKTEVIKTFPTQEEAKDYYNTELKEKLGSRGPTKRKLSENGFYEATIKKVTKVWSVSELNDKPYIGVTNNKYRFYSCYEDVNDKTTLQWWLIYY
jgi:hypothetical protein